MFREALKNSNFGQKIGAAQGERLRMGLRLQVGRGISNIAFNINNRMNV
jgi:hypothetical protein